MDGPPLLPYHPPPLFAIAGNTMATAPDAPSLAIQQGSLRSSMLSSYAYDPLTRVLTLDFVNGRTYDYHNVSQEEVDALEAAPSPGRYFLASLKGRG